VAGGVGLEGGASPLTTPPGAGAAWVDVGMGAVPPADGDGAVLYARHASAPLRV